MNCKGSAPVVLRSSLYTYASKLPTAAAAAGGGYTKNRVADELSLDNLNPELGEERNGQIWEAQAAPVVFVAQHA